jgi:hypothetical protein
VFGLTGPGVHFEKYVAISIVETQMHFSVFAKMQKIMQKYADFCKISQNFISQKFSFLQKFSQKCCI